MANPEMQPPSPAEAYMRLLDAHFDSGEPRRHGPGERLGQEEVFLDPPQEIPLLGDQPDRTRAIRPRANDTAPVRPPVPGELRGHRLEVVWSKPGDERRRSTVFYIDDQDQLRRKDTASSFPLLVRNPLEDSGWPVYTHDALGSLDPTSRDDRPLQPQEIKALLEYVPQLTHREPWEGW